MVGLPVIASNWSGHLDFLDTNNCILIGGDMKQVPKSQVWKNIIVEESQWFNVNETQVYKALNYCFQNYDDVQKKALNLMKTNREKFTLNKMTQQLDEIMLNPTSNLPSQVKLKLPKLKKVGAGEPSQIKLPKLKKVNDEETV